MRRLWNIAESPVSLCWRWLSGPRIALVRPISIPIGHDGSCKANAMLFYDSGVPMSAHSQLVLFVPGGGFLAMNPNTYYEAGCAIATRTKLPVLSLDYPKAPENPYPKALDQISNVVDHIFETSGKCIGANDQEKPVEVLAIGDSA